MNLNYRQGARLTYTWRVVRDPAKEVQVFADVSAVIEQGGRVPTSWMRRAAGKTGVTHTPVGQTPQYMGRTCCFVHLYPFQTRGDIRPGLETACPECGRVFEFVLEVQ